MLLFHVCITHTQILGAIVDYLLLVWEKIE